MFEYWTRVPSGRTTPQGPVQQGPSEGKVVVEGGGPRGPTRPDTAREVGQESTFTLWTPNVPS